MNAFADRNESLSVRLNVQKARELKHCSRARARILRQSVLAFIAKVEEQLELPRVCRSFADTLPTSDNLVWLVVLNRRARDAVVWTGKGIIRIFVIKFIPFVNYFHISLWFGNQPNLFEPLGDNILSILAIFFPTCFIFCMCIHF